MKTKEELIAREKEILAEIGKMNARREVLMKEHRDIVEQRYALQKDEAAQSGHANNAANSKVSTLLRNDRMRRLREALGDLGGADPTAMKKSAAKKEKAE